MEATVKLEVGMLIKTNYSGPYRIKHIIRGCTCPLYMESAPQPAHIHLTVSRPDGSGKFYLSHFFEDTLCSLDKTYCGFKAKLDFDRIIVLPPDGEIQTTLF